MQAPQPRFGVNGMVTLLPTWAGGLLSALLGPFGLGPYVPFPPVLFGVVPFCAVPLAGGGGGRLWRDLKKPSGMAVTVMSAPRSSTAVNNFFI